MNDVIREVVVAKLIHGDPLTSPLPTLGAGPNPGGPARTPRPGPKKTPKKGGSIAPLTGLSRDQRDALLARARSDGRFREQLLREAWAASGERHAGEA